MMHFMRYVRRFGHPLAAWLTPKMQVISGKAEPIKGPGDAAIEYWSLEYMQSQHYQAVDQGLTEWAEELEIRIDLFPDDPDDIAKLPSSAFLN